MTVEEIKEYENKFKTGDWVMHIASGERGIVAGPGSHPPFLSVTYGIGKGGSVHPKHLVACKARQFTDSGLEIG